MNISTDPQRLARLNLSEGAAKWLEETRALPIEVASEMGLVSQPGGVIGFQYRRNGQVTHVKWRTVDKTRMWQEPVGVEKYLWNLDCLTEASGKLETLVITEGEFDAVAWAAAGAPYVVSVPNGANLDKPGEGMIDPETDRAFSYLWHGSKLHPDIAKFDRIVLSTDNDDRGHILRDELAIRIGRRKCFWVDYPAGCKDANDVLIKHGLEGIGRLMRNIKPIVPNKLVPYADIPERSGIVGYSVGGAVMDKHLRLVPPELVVVTGTPGAGKSHWVVLGMVANLARMHHMRGAILQMEDHPDRNRRALLRYATSWFNQKNGITCDPQEWVSQMFLAIPPPESDGDDEPMDLEWLRNVIAEAATRHGCRWIVIDPWNEVEHVWRVNESETAYTNQALRELKRIGRQYQIIIIVVAHPAKGAAVKDIEELSLYDVSGSAAWKNKADHGIVIWRPDANSSETWVKVDKSKDFDVMGVPGIVRLQFNPRLGIYESMGA